MHSRSFATAKLSGTAGMVDATPAGGQRLKQQEEQKEGQPPSQPAYYRVGLLGSKLLHCPLCAGRQ